MCSTLAGMENTPRSCRRPGCGWSATASLSFRYATGQVWLLDLSNTPDPSLYDLCTAHADTLTVPRGWERVDERAQAVRQEPARRGPHGTAATAPEPVGARRAQGRRNRYEGLSRELPRLAARLAIEPDPDQRREAPVAGRDPVPVTSRDLAPVSFGAPLDRRRPA